MGLEILVLLICLQGSEGCNEGAKAYYAAKPRIRSQVRSTKQEIETVLGSEALYLGLTFRTIAHERLTLRLHKGLNLQIKENEFILKYTYRF